MASKRILVVDDSDLIRRVAKMSLEKMGGWEVVTASTGGEGVAAAEAEQPNAILLDFVLPDMDGPTTLQKLQANQATRNIPVVFMTGKEGAAESQGGAAGVRGVISKPFDPAALPGQVAQLLGWDR